MTVVHNLEAKIEELRTLTIELEAANEALKRERPKDIIAEARWEAEKIKLRAHSEAADMLRLAAFRRDLIVATADRDVSEVDLTGRDSEGPVVRMVG